MNQISQLLPLSNVIVDLDVTSKKRVFEQAGLLFENTNQIARSQVFDSLVDKLDRQILKHKEKNLERRNHGALKNQDLDEQ